MSEPVYPLLSVSRLRMETDGAGVTTLVAGAGCPLRCRYCINRQVLEKPGTPVTPQELYDRVKVDDLYFQATGGGVTFGGGEALLHAAFCTAFRSLCGNAWHLCAETSLNVPADAVREAAACIDFFIVDIKTADPEIYRAYTGRDGAPALENLKLLLQLAGPERVRVRIPLIPGYNTEEDRLRTERLVRELGVTVTERFPYIIRE